MSHSSARQSLHWCLIVTLALVSASTMRARVQPSDTTSEVRALWVTRATLSSPATIARMVWSAKQGGFNTIVVQVRGRGDAYYASALEPRASDLTARPAFDPLAETIAVAKRAGLDVHAWVVANLVSSAVELPASRQHVVYRQPDWLMVPRELAAEMLSVNPRSPEYLGRLARWSRARPEELEGLYTSPIHPAAAKHLADVVEDIARRYDIAGVHLDYIRYPNEGFDYSRGTLQQFKESVRADMTTDERTHADGRERIDPLAYPALYPQRWQAFRRARLTAMVMRVRTALKAARPSATLSAAVVPDFEYAYDSRLQDWRTWLDQSLVDVVCPMAYAKDLDQFEAQIAEVQSLAGGRPVWAGIGAYRLSADETLRQIDAARRLKTDGVILFSYDALTTPPNSLQSFAQLTRAAFGAGSY
jgi:uncharacterized lipoprotein YddW (UPF0748 family)